MRAAALIVLTALAAALPLAARADDAALQNYVCAPDGFTLTDTPDGLRLQGIFDAPLPGYRAVWQADRKVLSLVPPDDAPTMQLVSPVHVDVLVDAAKSADGTIEIDVEKPYAWGPGALLCSPAP